jgi:hypothetical protein
LGQPERHRSREFVAFLQRLDATYAVGMLICILFDNHSAHRSRETCNQSPIVPKWSHGIHRDQELLAA